VVDVDRNPGAKLQRRERPAACSNRIAEAKKKRDAELAALEQRRQTAVVMAKE